MLIADLLLLLTTYDTGKLAAEHAGHEARVRSGLVRTLHDGATADARTRALVSLLLALKAVHKAVDPNCVGLSKRELNDSAERVTEGDWVGEAVRSAIDRHKAAIIAATSPKGSFGGGGGGS